jgi:hypothetical protein
MLLLYTHVCDCGPAGMKFLCWRYRLLARAPLTSVALSRLLICNGLRLQNAALIREVRQYCLPPGRSCSFLVGWLRSCFKCSDRQSYVSVLHVVMLVKTRHLAVVPNAWQ